MTEDTNNHEQALKAELERGLQPLGITALYPGNNIPDEWMLCQGDQLHVEEYRQLYAVLGTRFGGDGTTSFSLPVVPSPVPGLRYIIRVGRTNAEEK